MYLSSSLYGTFTQKLDSFIFNAKRNLVMVRGSLAVIYVSMPALDCLFTFTLSALPDIFFFVNLLASWCDFLSALKKGSVSCALLACVWWLMFAYMYLYFTAVLQCFPILCCLPACLTMCTPIILLLFHAWGAISVSRIVEDNDKETGDVCFCYWQGARKPEFHVDTVTLPNVEDFCVEICGERMHL